MRFVAGMDAGKVYRVVAVEWPGEAVRPQVLALSETESHCLPGNLLHSELRSGMGK